MNHRTSRYLLTGLISVLITLPTAAEMVVVVSTNSELQSLPKAQVANVFLGRMNSLDGHRAEPVDQVEGRAVREVFYRDILGWTPAQIKAHWSKMLFTGRGRPPPQLNDDTDVIRFVTGNPGAIGYIDRSYVTAEVKVLQLSF